MMVNEKVWYKSTFSAVCNCVEVNVDRDTRTIRVRNSKDLLGPCVEFAATEWIAFIRGAKAGEFDAFAKAGRRDHKSERLDDSTC